MQKKILNSQKGYNLAARDYDKRESYLNSFERDVVWNLVGEVDGKKVLDVGAGTGRLAIDLVKRGAIVTALDTSDEMLKVLDKKTKTKIKIRNFLQIVVGEAESLSFPDESFDLVIATFLIVHLKDPRRFFDEVYRVLKPGGKFLVTNINQRRPPEIKTKEGIIEIESYYHQPEKIKEILEDLAFGIEKEVFVREGGTWINQIVLGVK